ncbi:unnamed protein product [Echinostoma caproni]|uniref:CUB domain-containing protein n=1 Tax=Echinostoma caproni TaxID=27848 RepID=A0A183A9N8_9TREM|nr:unnamed protein product [Echinostoma caproni]
MKLSSFSQFGSNPSEADDFHDPGGCGGVLRDGACVYSPEHPAKVRSGDLCAWRYYAPEGSHAYFSVSSSILRDPITVYGYLKLYDGKTENDPIISNMDHTINETFVAKSGTLFLVYHVEEPADVTGFFGCFRAENM